MTRFNRKTTIKDIAEAASVSTTTVLNVLKNRDSEVSPTTKENILALVSEMGYVKNLTASSLASTRSHTVAVIIAGVFEPMNEINPFYGEFVLRMEHMAQKRGYAITLFTGVEKEYIQFLLQRNFDAAVLLGVSRSTMPHLQACRHIPTILFDAIVDDPQIMSVRTDEHMGGSLAASHLMERDSRKLAFLGEVTEDPTTIPYARLQGVLAACEEKQTSLTTIHSRTTFESGYELAQTILEAGYDGIIASADIIAIGLLAGIHAATDTDNYPAIVGYDNLPISRMVSPSLTTIDQHLNQKIEAALDLVQKGKPGDTRIIPPSLIKRQST